MKKSEAVRQKITNQIRRKEEEKVWLSMIKKNRRKKVSTADLADQCACMIERFGTTQKELGKYLNYSQPRISNLLRFRQLPPEIVTDWHAGLIRERMLEKLCTMSHDAAGSYWATRHTRLITARRFRARLARGNGRRPGAAVLARLSVMIRDNPELDTATKELAIQVVEFAQGARTKILGIYDPCHRTHGATRDRDERRNHESLASPPGTKNENITKT